jgi:hypothetical protein
LHAARRTWEARPSFSKPFATPLARLKPFSSLAKTGDIV